MSITLQRSSAELCARRTTSNLDGKFTNQRIIGLVSKQGVYKGDINAAVLASKVTYEYDEMSGSLVYQSNPVHQDNDYYTTNTTLRLEGTPVSLKKHGWDLQRADL